MELSACAVSDAMNKLGLNAAINRIKRQAGTGVLVGPAFPVRFEPGDGPFNQYLPQVPKGGVVLSDADGREDVSVWGGLIAKDAGRQGIAGTVVHGACRDVDEINAFGYPLFAGSRTPVSGRGVVTSTVVGAVTIDGITVRRGDIIVADSDGLAIVPAKRQAEVLALAAVIEERDARLSQAIAEGASLPEARARLAATAEGDRG